MAKSEKKKDESWFHGTPKPFINGLSPGCRSCVEGKWSCIYINGLCTRKCSFCPQDKPAKKERLPMSDYITFRSSDEYISYLRKFDFSGVGFSGGEPFLVFELLLGYIKKIRKHFGSRHYLWVYTNGDLVTAQKLELLKKAGLNEIRFDISARDYDLAPVELAAKHIDTVTIEIPILPSRVAFMKGHLKKFEEIGVKYLNLHQIIINKSNYAKVINKKIIDKKNAFMDAEAIKSMTLESEQAAFEIMNHALRIKSNLKINYCSSRFKDLFQAQAARRRYAPFVMKKFDGITLTGYVRRLSILIPKPLISKPCEKLPNFFKNVDKRDIIVDSSSGTVIFDQKLLAKLADAGLPVRIDYYKPIIPTASKGKAKIRLHDGTPVKLRNSRFMIKLSQAGSFDLANESSALFFLKLFVEGKKAEKAVSEILRHFGLSPSMKADLLDDIKSFYGRFRNFEHLEIPAHNSL